MSIPKTGKNQKPQIIVILGHTSAGKSEMAVKFAKKINGEIISADSRQVYKHLNLATGKVEGEWKNLMLLQKNKVLKSQNTKHKLQTNPKKQNTKKFFIYKNIPHHCIDFTSPKKILTAEDFKKCAEKAVDEIIQKGKIPIIAGGAAFYIYALTGDISIPEIPPDWRLRKQLEKKSTLALFQMLKKLNPKRAKNIDAQNRRRLIRAVEITQLGGGGSKLSDKRTNYNVLWLGLKLPEKKLKKRIEKRLAERLKQGMIQEVKKVREKHGVRWKRLEEMGLEIKYASRYLRGFISKEEMIENIKNKTWQFSKRQMAWWKKDKRIKWISSQKDAEKAVKNFLKK